MRECFQNGHVKERLSKEHSEHVRKLCGMANNLNQLARKENAGVSLPRGSKRRGRCQA